MTPASPSVLDSSIARQSGWEKIRTEFLDKVRNELSLEEMDILERPGGEIQKQLDNLLKSHRPRWFSKALSKLQPFLAILDGFSGAIGVISNASSCASLAWGIFRIAVQMGQFAVERIATVSKYLHKIGKILDQLQRTEEQLPCQPKLREALEAAYGDILRVYLEIIRYLRRGTRWWKRILICSVRGFEYLYGEIAGDLKTSLEYVDRERHLAALTVFQEGKCRHGSVVLGDQGIFRVGPSQDFIGRLEIFNGIFDELGTHLSGPADSISVLRVVCLCGIGGVGKSMVAQKYTYTRRLEFPWVFWVKADTEQKLHSSFCDIATDLGVPSECYSDKAWMIREVKTRLSSATTAWLLVFDNADDINLIKEYWPNGGNGNVIITTRDYTAARRLSCHKITMNELSIPKGILFLKSLITEEHPAWSELDKESEIAVGLVNEVGALPIALCHAASTLKTGQSIEELLVQYRDPEQNKLFLEIDDGVPWPQREVLGKTWEASYEKLQETEAYALQCLAWVDHDGISKDFFRNINVNVFPSEIKLFLTDTHYQVAFNALTRSSLVTSPTGGDTIFVNRMVQLTTILRMTHERQTLIKTFSSVAVLLESKFPQPYASAEAIFPGVMEHTEECQKLIPHVLSLVKNYESYLGRQEIVKFGSLLQRAALYLLEIDNKQGEKLLQMSLDMDLPEEGHVVPHIQMNLAWNLMRNGSLEQAKNLGLKSLNLFKLSLGHQHVLTAWAHCNFGRILAFNVNFSDAKLHHQQAISIYESNLQSNPTNTTLRFALLVARNYLATALHCQLRGGILGDIYEPLINGNVEPTQTPLLTGDEKECLKQPLELCEAGLELAKPEYDSVFPNKQTLAWIELTLCWILLDLERFDEAEKYNSQALLHVKDRFSPDGCGVGVVTVQRADILNAQGKKLEAEKTYMEALNLLEMKMGHDNPLTALTYHKVGNFHCRNNRFADAVPLYESALESLEKSYGEHHPTTATTKNNLGIALINIDQRESGLQHLKGALEARRHHFPSSHKLVVRLAGNIAFLEERSSFKSKETMSEVTCVSLGDGTQIEFDTNIECLGALTVSRTPLQLQKIESVLEENICAY